MKHTYITPLTTVKEITLRQLIADSTPASYQATFGGSGNGSDEAAKGQGSDNVWGNRGW